MRILMSAVLILTACNRHAPPEPSATSRAVGEARYEADAPLPFDPGVRTGTLDNGLTWYIEPNPWPEDRAELRLVVRAGSVLEQDDQRGVAHLLEHLAFAGTEVFSASDIFGFLEGVGMRVGPDVNAYTSFDETVYMLHLPSDDPQVIDTGLLLLSQWADSITLDPAAVEQERGVVLEEWRIGLGAGSRLLDQVLPYLFHDSRYAQRRPIGTPESIRTVSREAIARFYDDWYRPELMAVVVVGDIDPDRVEREIVELFSPLTNPPDAPERPQIDIPTDHPTLVLVQSDPEVSQPQFEVFRKIEWSWGSSQRSYRERVVEQLALEMLNARLDEVGRSPEAAYLGAGAGRDLLTPTRSLELVGGTAREGQLLDAMRTALLEVRRAQVHGFTPTELERTKANTRRAIESWYEERTRTASSVAADEIVRHYLHGEPMPGTAWEFMVYEEFLPDIDTDEVDAWMQDFLVGENGRVVVATVPATSTPPTEQQILAVLREVEQTPVEPWVDEVGNGPLVTHTPEPGRIVARERVPRTDITIWTLSNGARVLFKPTNFAEDEILFAAWSWGGTSTVDDDAWISANLAVPVVRRSGLGTHDAVSLARSLTGLEVQVAPFISEYTEGIAGAAAPEDLDTALALLHLTFTEPRFDETAFELELRNRAEALRNREADPMDRYEMAVERILYGNHPRRRPWTVADLQQADLAELEAFYRDRYADAGDFTFVFVGNIDPAALERAVTTWVASLPADGEDDWRDVGIRPRTGPLREVVRAGLEDRARVLVQFGGEMDFDRNNARELETIAEILQLRLVETLRSEMAGTYGVALDQRAWAVPVPGYRVTATFETEPARVEEMTAAVYEVVEQLRQTPLPAHYVNTYVTQERRELETEMKQNGSWIGWLIEYDQAGWPLAQIADQDAQLRRIDPESVRRAARRFLDPATAIEIVLLPEVEVGAFDGGETGALEGAGAGAR